jgi:soluble lytic murein transglycosylase
MFDFSPSRAMAFVVVAALAATPVGAHAGSSKARAAASRPAPGASQDERFMLAREAFRAGQYTKVAEQAEALRGYVLESYVDYYLLRMRLEELPVQSVRTFLARHDGAWIAEQLRRDWLKVLGRRKEWGEFDLEVGRVASDDADVACYALQSRWRRGDKTAVDELARYWSAPRELPDGCVPLAEAELAAGRMTVRHVWERARILLDAGQMPAAKRVLAYLPAGEQPDDATLDRIARSPGQFAEKADKLDLKKRVNRELLLFALARAARNDADLAASHFPRALQDQLPPDDRAWAWAQIATAAAKRHSPRAVEWFVMANGAVLTDEQLEWRARAALRAENWAELRDTLERMPPAQRNAAAWTYWGARGARAGGQAAEAEALFGRVAGEHNFYGKLALEELGQALVVPSPAQALTADAVAEAAANPGLRRALTLFRLEQRFEAVREWNWTLRGMNDRQLLAAAELARRAQIWDRAINTADRTVALHDFKARFLAPYRDVFAEQARAQGLEESLVLGLVRQESRFIVNARSSAGASGLMQLMPATAKWVAKQIGMKDFSQARVTEVDVNVALGTGYLKYVMDELDGSPVLAAAAYNAGPGRARRWKADGPLEGAIYAETIPFNETRDYVKQVMSNTMYYAAIYGGEPRPLKTRLGTIPGRRGGEGYAATITGQPALQ